LCIFVDESPARRAFPIVPRKQGSDDQGIDWSIITAATLLTSAPFLVAFLLFQKQFVQSFMRAGIK